jgi:hypothetical protein
LQSFARAGAEGGAAPRESLTKRCAARALCSVLDSIWRTEATERKGAVPELPSVQLPPSPLFADQLAPAENPTGRTRPRVGVVGPSSTTEKPAVLKAGPPALPESYALWATHLFFDSDEQVQYESERALAGQCAGTAHRASGGQVSGY